ncbi:MAG: GNAT family N-acetyltransferase [Sphingomonadales bacterium]
MIRPAAQADQPALAAIYREASLAWDDTRADLLAHPEVLMLEPDCWQQSLLAATSSDITGFVTLRNNGDGTGTLDHLFVLPAQWRTGVGRALMAAAIAGCDPAIRRIDVVANNNALPFYRNVGFLALGPVETRFATGTAMQLPREN